MRYQIIKIHLLFLLIVISYSIKAQENTIKGKLIDKVTEETVKDAVVMLISEKDSVLISFTRTDSKGNYTLPEPKGGNYIFMTSHPLYADYVDNISVGAGSQKPLQIKLTNKSKLLEAIIIKAGGSIKIKGDTTIYTADSFNVSANANVEELLK